MSSSSPAGKAYPVTPSDSANLTRGQCRALYVGSGGNVTLVCDIGEPSVTFSGVANGSILPVETLQVLATGTTASQIIALY